MIKKLTELGVTKGMDAEERQIVRLTNIVATIPFLAYAFYTGYGFYFNQWFSFFLAGTATSVTIVAVVLNARGYYTWAKVLLFFINALVLSVTYHVFNVDYSALTGFFPIFFCYPVFFFWAREWKAVVASVTITILLLAGAFFVPRFMIYQVILAPQVLELSNLFHWLISFLLTGLIVMAIAMSRRKTYKVLIEQREKAESTLRDLKKAQDRLVESEKMASLGLLTAGINHEINNPLTFMKGGILELKASEVAEEGDTRLFLDMIDEGLQRIEEIVKSLNHFNYKSDDFNQSVKVQLVLKNCLNILNHKVKQGVEVDISFPNEEVFVKGNSGQLHQVFLNLLDNAVHAVSGQGKVWLSVNVNDDGFVVITVEDNGAGIEESIRARIFDPFFTTKEPGTGTGLGLAIVRKILVKHAGDIHVTSELGKGSKFLVKLPVERIELRVDSGAYSAAV